MTWRPVPDERTVVYSQFALRLVDEFTGGPLRHRVEAQLSYQDSAGDWRPLEVRPTPSPAGNLLYPGLGRSASFGAAPVVRHRVQLESDFYRPDYLRTADALEFDIHPYDDTHPPAALPGLPQTVFMLPSALYRYDGVIRTVRGRTLDMLGDPVANTEVTVGTSERVLSDDRGVFSLPLRWVPFAGNVLIDAVDHRTGRSDQITLTLPQDLLQGQTFTLT